MKVPGPIVIVDDDTDDHFIFKEIAKNLKLEHEILFFASGVEVLQYLRTTDQTPFLIVCDINMPLIGGLELRRKINEDDRLRQKNIPFVFFTTAASLAQLREAYDLTVQGFFVKEPSFLEMERTFKLILDYWTKCKHPSTFK